MPQISGAAKRLSIYVREADWWNSEPLYLAIVHKAKNLELAGASVFRGLIGYEFDGRNHTSKYQMSDDMPVLVEIVDTIEYIDKIMPYLTDMVREGSVKIDDRDDFGIFCEERWLIEFRWNWKSLRRSA